MLALILVSVAVVAVAVTAVAVGAGALLLWMERRRSPHRIVDGYAVVVNTWPASKGIRAHADIHVELMDGELSRDPAYAVARAGGLAQPWSLLSGSIHHTVWLEENERVDEAIREIVAYAKKLGGVSRSIRGELLAGALESADAEVRLRCLRDLARQYPGSAEAKKAARAGLLDAEPAVRLRAAILLDEEGLAQIEAIVRDAREPAELRIEGLRHLSRAIDQRGFGALLEAVLDSGSGSVEVAEAAIAAYGEFAGSGAVERFARMLRGSDARRVVAIVRALAEIADPAAEPILIELLDRPEPEVQLAAVRALSRVGSVAAISKMVILSGRTGEDHRLHEILKASIALLRQGRGQDVALGQLSLAGPPPEGEGSLSLSDRASTLSFPEDSGSAAK